MATLKHLTTDYSFSMEPAPHGEIFGPSPTTDYMTPILEAAEAEVAPDALRLHKVLAAAYGELDALALRLPPTELEETMSRLLQRAQGFRQLFPPERLPAGNYDHPIGPMVLDVYWGSEFYPSRGSAQCRLCEVEWSFDAYDCVGVTCWSCGRSQDRPPAPALS